MYNFCTVMISSKQQVLRCTYYLLVLLLKKCPEVINISLNEDICESRYDGTKKSKGMVQNFDK